MKTMILWRWRGDFSGNLQFGARQASEQYLIETTAQA